MRPKVENNETSFLSTSEKLASRLTSDCSDSVVLNVDRVICYIFDNMRLCLIIFAIRPKIQVCAANWNAFRF